ncbi:MAG: hypothetical protein SOR73_09530 [Romboutsia timonensis]|uniref:hypothetical protein n=1 Tax=Romboutsia timonensis TaxID=1776391 RepID=UPI002A74782C|nr:hypothetical protein [Romboutsia timonensis]MDY3001891.1 hypothetical protein [Romboutsia timonensis]
MEDIIFKKIVIGVILSLSIVLNLFLIDKNKSFDSTNVNLKEKIDELNSENNKLTKELDETKNNLSIELATFKGGLSKAQDAINNTLNSYED